jgi:hypothetical protein
MLILLQTLTKCLTLVYVHLSTHILHHSQQDQKNRVSKRKIKASRLYDWQETRFLMLVQDISLGILRICNNELLT